MNLYERIVRPLLFLLPAERAHSLGKRALSLGGPWRMLSPLFRVEDPRLETEVGGLRLRSPVGLTAGFDKDADALPGLSHLGFGSITVGAVMPMARRGNPSPRLLHLPKEMALLNSMGLPSKGLEHALRNLRRYRESRPAGAPPIIANVGGFSIEEVLACHRAVEPWVDAVELDLTCPNVDSWGDFEKMEGVVRLTERLMALRRKPLFYKVPLRSSEENFRRAVAIAEVAVEFGVEGVTAGGGIRVEDARLAVGRGSLTGPPALENSVRFVRDLRGAIGGGLAIRIAGGIFDGEGAFRLLKAGADSVNILTAFVYLGPSAAAQINRGLLRKMDEEGVKSVREFKPQPSLPEGLLKGPAGRTSPSSTPSVSAERSRDWRNTSMNSHKGGFFNKFLPWLDKFRSLFEMIIAIGAIAGFYFSFESNRTAKASLELTKQEFELKMRPIVGVVSFTVDKKVHLSQDPAREEYHFSPRFKNNGTVIAKNVGDYKSFGTNFVRCWTTRGKRSRWR